jgi:Cys-tRNA(Pro)/Cys-tRNA(Cys) deacylase
MMKTIAARMLDRMQIEYELRANEFSEEEMDAISVAQKIGMPPNAVFKTLVARAIALE